MSMNRITTADVVTIPHQNLLGRFATGVSMKAVIVAAFATCIAEPASAIFTLPPATYTGSYAYGPGGSSYSILAGPGKVTHTGAQSASASAVSLPQTMVEITGYSGPSADYVYADARIQYSFAIFATINTNVDVIVTAGAGAGGSGSHYYSDAYVGMYSNNSNKILVSAHACNNESGCFGTTGASTKVAYLSISTNEIYTFDLNVNAIAKTPYTSFDVWADPTVVLDPAFQAPLGAKLVVNTGRTAIVGGVAEPESWALLIAGFCAVGAMSRRARVRRVVA